MRVGSRNWHVKHNSSEILVKLKFENHGPKGYVSKEWLGFWKTWVNVWFSLTSSVLEGSLPVDMVIGKQV